MDPAGGTDLGGPHVTDEWPDVLNLLRTVAYDFLTFRGSR